MLDPDYRRELERQQKERDGEIIWKYKTEDKVTDFIIQNDKIVLQLQEWILSHL